MDKKQKSELYHVKYSLLFTSIAFYLCVYFWAKYCFMRYLMFLTVATRLICCLLILSNVNLHILHCLCMNLLYPCTTPPPTYHDI